MKKQTQTEAPTQSQPAPLPSQLNSEVQAQKIESLAQDAASIDSANELFKPEKPQRGPRGPYKKKGSSGSESQTQAAGSTPGPAAPSIPSSEIVRPTINTIDAWTQRIAKNPKVAMWPEEKEGICKSLGLVLDKWAPIFVQQNAAEIMAIMAISAWGTRVYAIVSEDQRIRREEYALKVKAQQSVDVNKDPNPAAIGRDHNPPPAAGPKYGNPFATLPQ